MSSYLQTTLSWLRAPALFSSGIAVIASGLLYFKQNDIIYPRNMPPTARTLVPKPSDFHIQDYEELSIRTLDEESLHAFLVRPSNTQWASRVTLLMFHGNAGNIGHRLPIAKMLAEEYGYNVFMLEYRGYGFSSGDPNEKGLMIDAQAGLDYIRKRDDLSKTKLVIYGQSLGGAVAIGLVEKNQDAGDIKALILENTFLSIRRLIPSILPPARYVAPLCHQIWPSEETLPKILEVPILFLSGLQDEIVPASHMKSLYDICKSTVKLWREFPEGSHNDTVAEPRYFEYIDDFIQVQVLNKKGRLKP